MPGYRAFCALRRCAPKMEAYTTCTVHADGGVCNRYAAAPIVSASGTMRWMTPVHVELPWLAIATLVASSPWGDASDEVTSVATGTQQYRRSSTLRAHLDQVLHTVVLPGLTWLNSEGARLNR